MVMGIQLQTRIFEPFVGYPNLQELRKTFGTHINNGHLKRNHSDRPKSLFNTKACYEIQRIEIIILVTF